MKKSFKIGTHRVGGEENQVFFIAEIGGNHQGDISLAKKMIDGAFYAGADAVKFQTYITENVLTKKSIYFDEFKREELSFDEVKILSDYAKDKGITFFSTPFDFESVEFLASIDVPIFKIASCDINNFPLIKKITDKRKPILLSTGASSLDDVEKAINYLEEFNITELALMQCTSVYPVKDDEANIRVISTFKDRFDIPIGLSDHSQGHEIALASVALGACIIEKHFTIDRALSGGDNSISILPEELKFLIDGSKRIRKALGKGEKKLTLSETNLQKQIRKGIVAKRNITKGETLTEENLAIKRPATEVLPKDYFVFLGMQAKCNISMDETITQDMLDKNG